MHKYTICYHDNIIWGIGLNETQAINDALENLDDVLEDGEELKTAPCTKYLYDEVQEKGGDAKFAIDECGWAYLQ